jgi:hypothetical protein
MKTILQLAQRSSFRSLHNRSSSLQGLAAHLVRSLSNVPIATHKVDYEFENLVEMQIKSCDLHKDEKFLGTFNNSQGSYEYINFAEFGEQVNKFRGVLAVHNIGVDDKVCEFMKNCRISNPSSCLLGRTDQQQSVGMGHYLFRHRESGCPNCTNVRSAERV